MWSRCKRGVEGRGDVPALSAVLVISAGGIRGGKNLSGFAKNAAPGTLDTT